MSVSASPRPSVRVLIVDDEPANLLALEAVLQEIGATLVRAGSGQEALKKTLDDDFAAILLDVRMPGMDGFETARLIRSRARSRTTPILFVTAADSSDLSIEEGYALGAVDFLTKPLIPAVLQAKVSFFIELQRSRDELRAAERQAVNERAFVSAVLEAVEDSIVACDAEGRLTLFNRATRELHGLAEEPIPPAQWAAHYALYHADGKTPLAVPDIPLMRALAGERVRNVEMVVAPVAGAPRILLASGQPLYDPSTGAKLGAVVSMHDVTVQREAEAARNAALLEQAGRERAESAAEANAKFRAFFDQGSSFAAVITLDGRVLEANQLLLESSGLQRDEISGLPFAESLWHGEPEWVGRVRDAVTRAAAGQLFRGELPYLAADGTPCHIDLSLTPVLDDRHEVRFIAASGLDITERRRAEAAVRASEVRYRSLFESVDEGVCVIEVIRDAQDLPVDYRIIEANPAFFKQTDLRNAIGQTIRALLPSLETNLSEIYGKVADTGEPVRLVHEARGIGRWYDIYASRVGGPGSQRVVVVFNDITERVRADLDLRRIAAELAESDRRKTEFLATLAHELRNPLAPLRNGLHLLSQAERGADVLERTRTMMARQVSHMVRLIDDLLDIARVTSGKVELKRERVELRTVVESAVETVMPLFEAAGHALALQLPAEPLWLDVDPTRLEQVLGNLLNNAAKYTAPGGNIALAAWREGDQMLLTVSDTGVGIAADALGDVFLMFTQVGRDTDRAQGGLGIGLSLVRGLVELHGGSVTAISPGLGQGSTFSVRLPLAGPVAAPAVPAHDALPELASSPPPLRVLVVDDNKDAAESLAMILQMGGHTARVANDGERAIQVVREFEPEIVFLDIGMPGKDGYEVAREVRRGTAGSQPVLVALTGWGSEGDRAKSRAAGFDHHLTKPAEIAAVERLMVGLTRP